MSSYAGPWSANVPAVLHRVAESVQYQPVWVAVAIAADDSARCWLHSAALADPRSDDGNWLVDPIGCDVVASVAADGAITWSTVLVDVADDAPMTPVEARGYVRRSVGSSGRSGATHWRAEASANGYRVTAIDAQGVKIGCWDLDVSTLSVFSVKF